MSGEVEANIQYAQYTVWIFLSIRLLRFKAVFSFKVILSALVCLVFWLWFLTPAQHDTTFCVMSETSSACGASFAFSTCPMPVSRSAAEALRGGPVSCSPGKVRLQGGLWPSSQGWLHEGSSGATKSWSDSLGMVHLAGVFAALHISPTL